MMVHHKQEFQMGYTPIAELDGAHSNMLMDFGILKIAKSSFYTSEENKERAYLLLNGEVEYRCEGVQETVSRFSLLDDEPYVLHVPSGMSVTLNANTDVEICVQKIHNDEIFEPVFFDSSNIRSQRFGEGTMQDTSTRIVRTVFDASNAPKSAMVLGEVINYGGKWSSYPPHNHAQPEIYHYRFPTAAQGFGYGELEDDVYKIKHQSSLMIPPFLTHSQVAAPGYPMYYVWMIPHLPDDKFGPDSRIFKDEHKWLLDSKAKIWPEK